MAINLQKGQRIDIGLQNMTIGLGWDPNEGTGYDFDLDASAFMIDDQRLIPSEPFLVGSKVPLMVIVRFSLS